MQLTIVNPDSLYDPVPNGYSHAVVAEGGVRIAFIAGQGGEDRTGALSPQFKDQVRQAYTNLGVALDAVGAKPNQVAKITTHVVDYDQSLLDVMTQCVKEMFGDMQASIPFSPRLCSDDMETLKHAAIQGLGIVALPAYICRTEIASGFLHRILPDWTAGDAELSILMPSRYGVMPAVKALMEFLIQQVPGVLSG
ncbi:LysR substrate-binding domain-containing protein [Sedimenticola sp.]|uniref:LysR substrate-binding domain-containing protein n=1 Tax=Sedimenticola sp. TaxID=1940285 RepID=UPI003D0F4DCE